VKSVYRFISAKSKCPYLADRMWQLEYVEVAELSSDEYLVFINQGWRRFGYMLFRPACQTCRACQPIRVPVERFKPNRNQKRVIKANSDLTMTIGEPRIDEDRVSLYVRHHEYRSETRNWPDHDPQEAAYSIFNFVDSPTPVQEWAFFLGDELVGAMYIDELPDGFSGIYFYHAPEYRDRSIGNYMCLSLIAEAQLRSLPHVYFGYYVAGCISMEYKAAFKPNQVLTEEGWQDFLV
jgi:leucyl-tRNA---protein transferase